MNFSNFSLNADRCIETVMTIIKCLGKPSPKIMLNTVQVSVLDISLVKVDSYWKRYVKTAT